MEESIFVVVCGARYKTRPGLTYHYNHSHKDRGSSGVMTGDEDGSSEAPPSSPSAGTSSSLHPPVQDKGTDPASVQGWTKFQDSYLTFLNTPGMIFIFCKKLLCPFFFSLIFYFSW